MIRHEDVELCAFLVAQRESVLAIVDDLDEGAFRKSVLPSGWTPLGMIAHLVRAEQFWFERVVSGLATEPPRSAFQSGSADAPFTGTHPVADVLTCYRDQGDRSDALLAATSLGARPLGTTPPGLAHLAGTVRTVVLHMIEETARHAGHLDVARELLDGRTGLGPR